MWYTVDMNRKWWYKQLRDAQKETQSDPVGVWIVRILLVFFVVLVVVRLAQGV